MAFLWIIITVLLQGKELSLQREEIEKMRATQEEQTKLLLLENERNTAAAVDAKIRAMVAILRTSLNDMAFEYFRFSPRDSSGPQTGNMTFVPENGIDPTIEPSTREWAERIQNIHSAISKCCADRDCVVSEPSRPTSWLACLTQADAIIRETNNGASEAMIELVFYDLKLPLLERVLKEALEDDGMWQRIEAVTQ